jgi:hypothetical protein
VVRLVAYFLGKQGSSNATLLPEVLKARTRIVIHEQVAIIHTELWKIAFKILPFPSSNTVFALFTSKALQTENIW